MNVMPTTICRWKCAFLVFRVQFTRINHLYKVVRIIMAKHHICQILLDFFLVSPFCSRTHSKIYGKATRINIKSRHICSLPNATLHIHWPRSIKITKRTIISIKSMLRCLVYLLFIIAGLKKGMKRCT